MPQTNILTLNYNDDQSVLINKINNNFDEVVELHGGDQGLAGETGPAGPIGEIGPKGPTGRSGLRGTKWIISSSTPAGGVGDSVILGDYWINSNTGNISVFSESGWISTEYNLNPGDPSFDLVTSRYNDNASPLFGLTGASIVINQNDPSLYSVIFSDANPESGPTNPDLSKFVVSTDSSTNPNPILEFSRSDIETGLISDYTKHPVFKWESTGSSNSSLIWSLPGGSFVVGASGGISAKFNASQIQAEGSVFMDYGLGTTGFNGIYSTGGIQVTSNRVVIDSKYFTYSRGSFNGLLNGDFLSIKGRFNVNYPNAVFQTPALHLSGLSGTILDINRSNDVLSTSSSSYYALSLSSAGTTAAYLDSRGKLLTASTYSPITFPNSSSGITGSASGPTGNNVFVSWYLLSQPYTESLYTSQIGVVPVTSGNTLVFTPNFPNLGGTPQGSYLGIGLYSGRGGWNDAFNASTGPTASRNFLSPGESVNLTIHCISDTYSGYSYIAKPTSTTWGFQNWTDTSNYNGFSYIGYGSGPGPGNVNNLVSLPFKAQTVDFTFYRCATGGYTGGINVYWTAYGLGFSAFGPVTPTSGYVSNIGGSAGFFTIPDIY